MASFQPVTAALRVLDVLTVVNRLREASVGDIFRETGLNRPTIVRMLETLIAAGFVARHATHARYLPTGRTLNLSSGYQRHEEMALAAAPVLAALHKRLQWPSDVAVFDGDAMVVAQTSRGEGFLQFNRRPGYRAPLLGTSLGLSYLAFSSPAVRSAALARLAGSAAPWDGALRKPTALARRLDQIRIHGYATMNRDYGSTAYGGAASAIGVPVRSADTLHGSLNVMFLHGSIEQAAAIERFAVPLHEAAAEIARALQAIRGGTHL